MKLLSHIDIREPQRIQALLEDPRNYAWRAIDSEKLVNFTPDIGLSAYPVPSVVRTVAGHPAQLRHRFWQTIEGQADHTGWRYIGVLIYLAAGQAHPLELKLGDMDIGRVQPLRADNRRHLIVADRAVEFIGEMEVMQIDAAGDGDYRIESVVLLDSLPKPSRFVPRIDKLQARLHPEKAGEFSAEVHFTTALAAPVEAVLRDESGAEVAKASGESTRLHQLHFDGLTRERRYSACVTARDFAGETDSAALEIDTTTTAPPINEVVVPLEICLADDADMAGLPLTFGLPFARGALPQIEDCCLRAGEECLPASAKIQSRWDDDSVQWALFETRAPMETSGAALHVNGGRQVSSADGDASSMLDNLQLADWQFTAVLGDGEALQSSQPVQLRRGKTSAVYAVEHRDARGATQLRSKLWLRACAGQRFVTLRHRLEVIAPEAAAQPDEAGQMLSLRQFTLRLPFAAQTVQHGGEHYALDGGWQLRHDHDLAHEICGETRDGRAEGRIRLAGENESLGVAVRSFWQTYPKALTVDSQGIDIEFFPERRGRELPGDEHAPHRLYFWLDAAGYKLKAGLALSSQVLLDLGGDPRVVDWLETPPLARPTVDYLNSCEVMPKIGARRGSRLPDYETLTDSALNSFQVDREGHRAYGQLNFGDWYGESGWSWGNNEYDSAYCGYSEFLRGGDAGWAHWAADAARHLADVDTVNSAPEAGRVGGQAMHIPGHLGGYLPPFFRSKMRGTNLIPSHIWVEGPLLHWLLTGDEASCESLQKTREWLLQKRFFDAYDFNNAREAGWHLIHLCALASLDDAAALNAASLLVARVLERQAPGGGWLRMLTDSHCGCGYPRCTGATGFMVGVLLCGLMRYYRLTHDAAVADAIVGGARWLIRNTFDHASGHFRYTSCVNRTLGGKFQATQWVLEGLAAAWACSGDEEIGGYLSRGLAVIGRFPVGIDHSGLGKAIAQQMRYVPSILGALQQCELAGEPPSVPPTSQGEAGPVRKP